MPKQIVFVVDDLVQDFDAVSCWPKQWFPDNTYEVRAEPSGGEGRYRVVVTPTEELPVPNSDVYSGVEIGVDFFDGEALVAELRDTVRTPGPSPPDEDACDPACVE